VVLLVAGEQRIPLHRHPLPTITAVGSIAMIVVCARRGGLIANLTRLVAFGRDVSREERYARLLNVDVSLNTATFPGRRFNDVLSIGVDAYAVEGFSADEWRRHHQGGPTGYAPRVRLVTMEDERVILASQAVAWNPSVPGLKSEDTVLVSETGVEVLTADPAWPTVSLGGLQRPLILVR
jgi:Xaa-Pro aminopeptidase